MSESESTAPGAPEPEKLSSDDTPVAQGSSQYGASPALAEQPEKQPFWGYQDLLAFLAAAVPALLVAALIAKLLFNAFALRGQGKAPELLAAQFLGYLFWFVFLYLLLRLKYGRPFWQSLGWVRASERFWRWAGWGALLAIAVSIAGSLLRTPDLDMPMKHLLSDRMSVLLIGVAAATVGPVCEEVAFRGFLMPLMVRSMGAPLGIVLSALPFALLHGPQYAWSWRHIVLITVAGVAFGYVRYRSGSTAAAAIVHAAYNTTFFLAFVLYGKDLPAKW
jgi:membrane protease YdiL (CAAX protease family)